MSTVARQYTIHEHSVLNSRFSPGPKVVHSHEGGGTPHLHPNMGPSFFGYREPKRSAKPKGEQFEYVPLPEEDQSFELVITDSALMSTDKGLVPIDDRAVNLLSMAAAERMKSGHRLKCIVRDERKTVRR